MSEPQEQRRIFRRYEVQDLHGSLLFRFDVKVLNLSLTGAAVETTRQLKLGKVYSLRFGGELEELDLEGAVKWCHLVGTRRGVSGELMNVFHAGLELQGTLSHQSAKLIEFMEKHVILALEKRVIGRFKVKAGSPIALAVRYDFEVLKLSLSGMLVQTRLLPEVDSAFEMELKIGGKPFDVFGRIAYAKRIGGTDSDPESQLGVQFLGLDEERSRMLQEFIALELE